MSGQTYNLRVWRQAGPDKPCKLADYTIGEVQPEMSLLEMLDHITTNYDLTRQQAYIVASVAVDLRIGQLVDAPNVGVTAILPLDIFEAE